MQNDLHFATEAFDCLSIAWVIVTKSQAVCPQTNLMNSRLAKARLDMKTLEAMTIHEIVLFEKIRSPGFRLHLIIFMQNV